jgi:hypothetical protein
MYSFYQAKSIKQALAEQSLDDAIERKQTEKLTNSESKFKDMNLIEKVRVKKNY